MTTSVSAEQLFQQLLSDPAGFNRQGKANALLKEYFNGLSPSTLRPLLNNKDGMVRHAAVWVASELGQEASSLIHEVVPLLSENDRFIRYHALETVMVCSFDENVGEFVHVVRALESDDEVIRVLAMRLVSNAGVAQLEAGVQSIETSDPHGKVHKQGLLNLLECEALKDNQISSMLQDREALIRKYGAIAAKKLSEKFPRLIPLALLSSDMDVQKFFQ